jgi:hypothetical protein
MAILNCYSVYPFAEMVQVKSEGVTPVSVMTLPKGTVVEKVLTKVAVAAVRAAGAATLMVGDNDTANGFITASDAKAAVGTVYGEVPTVRGSYLYDSTVKGSYIKHYASDKIVKFALNVAVDTEGEYQVTVIGHRIGF